MRAGAFTDNEWYGIDPLAAQAFDQLAPNL